MQRTSTRDLEFYLNKKQRLEKAGQLRWFHWLIILVSLLVTIYAWTLARNTNQQQIDERFDREAHQVVELITERMTRYEDALWGGVAALSTNDSKPNFQTWKNYSESLKISDKYPGINGIGVIDFIPPDEMEAYLAAQRKYVPDFRVFPEHNESEFWPISFIEPLSENRPALGLDMAHETNRLAAARKARDSGTAQITGPIRLVQDEEQKPGFLFYAPHYNTADPSTVEDRRDSFVNLVYAPFVFEQLMIGILEKERRLVRLHITDDGVHLFDEIGHEDDKPREKALRSTQIVKEVYGRRWVFEVESNEAFKLSTVNYKPLMVLLSGIGVELLIISLFLMLARANRQAVQFADDLANAYGEKSNLLENIFNNAIDGVILSGADGEIRDFNKACESLFGYDAAEVIGKDFDILFQSLKQDFLADPDSQGADPTQKVIEDYYTDQMREVTGRRKDGSNIMLEISKTEIKERGDTVFNTIVRDVSDRKAAEAKLKKTMEDLVFSNRDLESFAYVASHDLKSPLRAIDNLSQWIAEDIDPDTDAENHERVLLLRKRVARMEDLLNSLLSYSRAGKVFDQTNRNSAGDLVREVRELLDIPEGFDVEISPALDDIMIARMPMEQVFHNLISNVLKHHDKTEGKISISARQDKDYYIFEVSDDGPGIDPAFHDKIFDMFQTLRPRDEVEGSGMGLALVKKMLDRHGGFVKLRSMPGEGSTFVVHFPKAH